MPAFAYQKIHPLNYRQNPGSYTLPDEWLGCMQQTGSDNRDRACVYTACVFVYRVLICLQSATESSSTITVLFADSESGSNYLKRFTPRIRRSIAVYIDGTNTGI